MKMRFLFFIGFLIFCCGAFTSQNDKAGDTVKIKKLLDQADQLLHINPDSALMLAKQANTISIDLNWKTGITRSLASTGLYYGFLNQQSEAIAAYNKVIAMLTEKSER